MYQKMKTVIALLIVSVLVISLAACSKPKKSSSLEDELSAYADALESELANMTLGDEESDVDNDVESKVEEKEEEEDEDEEDTIDILPEFDKNASFSNIVLTETFGVRITATGIEYNNYSVDVKLKFENLTDSARKVHSGTAGYCCNSINGYMVQDGYLSCEIEAGGTEEDDVSFNKVELNVRGITKIADIEIAFEISDDDYNKERTGPISIKTTLADKYNYHDDTYLKMIKGRALQNAYGIKIDKVVEEQPYSEGGVTMLSEVLMRNKDDESSLLVEFDNTSDQTLYVVMFNLSVNGTSAYEYSFVSDMVCNEKKLISIARLSNLIKDVSALDGQKITSVSFEIELRNEDYQSLTQPQTVTINF